MVSITGIHASDSALSHTIASGIAHRHDTEREHVFKGEKVRKYRPLHMLFPVICASILLLGCSGGGSNPSGPGEDDPGQNVRETKSLTVGSGGGAVTLSGGVSVVFPAGAVTRDAGFTISELTPESYFEPDDEFGRVVLRCTGDIAEFAHPVEILAPLPVNMTIADSARVFGGYIDETDGSMQLVPCAIRVVEGKPFAVMAAEHFSIPFLSWLVKETPPASAGPLQIPYYSQGESNYCWAASLQMLTQAASFEKRDEIPGIIGAMGVDESGISSYKFRMSSAITGIVKSRAGVAPERSAWDFVNYGLLKDHLKREIGVRGVPVAVHSTAKEHAVVVVGYSGNTFYVHDPASMSGGSIGYTARTWDELSGGMGLGSNMVSLSIPKKLDASRPAITVNILNNAVQFIRPPTPDDATSNIYWFRWDYANKDGYGFLDGRTQKLVETLPGTVTVLRKSGDIEIANSSRSASADVSVWVDVVCLTQTGAYYSDNVQVSVPANAVRTVSFPDIPVDEFRWNTASGAEYSLIIRAMQNGTLTEEQAVTFKIDTRPVKVDTLTPARGGVGTRVAITGSGFGTIPKTTKITFNGVEAEFDTTAWSDTRITAIVPEGAKTGPLVVSNGDVKGKAVEFTVTEERTVVQTINYRTTGNFGENAMTVTGTISVTGEVGYNYIEDTTNFYSLEVVKDTPVTVTISMSGVLDQTEHTVVNSDSSTTVTTYHTPKMTPLTDTEYDEWPVTVRGDFPHTVSENSMSFTLTTRTQSMTAQAYFGVYADIRRYDKEGILIEEREDVFINGRVVATVYVKTE